MNTDQAHLERRAGQRFDYHIPVMVRGADGAPDIASITENLGSRGAFLYTDAAIHEGSVVELTFTMPSEITLGEAMRVRCRGKVLRAAQSEPGPKYGIAVHFETYEYLSTDDANATTPSFERLSSLHAHVAS